MELNPQRPASTSLTPINPPPPVSFVFPDTLPRSVCDIMQLLAVPPAQHQVPPRGAMNGAVIPHTHGYVKSFVDCFHLMGPFTGCLHLLLSALLIPWVFFVFFSSQCSRDVPPGTNSICSETNICGHFPVEIAVISCAPSTLFPVCPYVIYNIRVLRGSDPVFVIPKG